MDPLPASQEFSDADAAWMLEAVLTPEPPLRESQGDLVGPYRLVRELGEGGFGVVWQAEQSEPVERQVALKMIKWGMDTREVLGRFGQERLLLARMTHPNIARMFDAGMAPDGRPYFVMELVLGLPITRYCREHQLPVADRIRLFKGVCMGVQHAHQKGVIHRDLKPTNILVTMVDGVPTAKIIDFGIAKAVQGRGSRSAVRTRADVAIGTPLYMSPEQLETPAEVETSSDIYSLGAVLYELLSGLPPFDPHTLSTSSQQEMRRLICQKGPERPSKRGNGVTLSPDLDWITLRAMHREPSKRYASAAELAEDLERSLQNLPTNAHPVSRSYLIGRWIKRNRTMFAAVSISTVAVLVGLVTSIWQARLARAEKAAAEQSAARATAAEAAAEQAQASAERTAAFLAKLLDDTTKEISKGRNPEAFKLALNHSYQELQTQAMNPELESALRSRLAGLYRAIGDWGPALQLMQEEVQELAAKHGPNSDTAWKAELEYFKKLADHGPRVSVPPLIEAAMQRMENAGLHGSKAWLDAIRELVRVRLKLDDTASALAASEQMMQELTKHRGKKVRIPYLVTRAEALERTGRYDEAEDALEKAQKLQHELDQEDAMAVSIHERLVSLLRTKGDLEEGLGFVQQRLHLLADQPSADQRAIISSLQRKAAFLSDLGRLPEALKAATEALELARQLATTDEGDTTERDHGAGACLLTLSALETKAGQHQDAMARAQEAVTLATEQGHTTAELTALLALGTACRAAGEAEAAIASYQAAHEIRLKSPDHRTRTRSLEDLTLVCLQFERFPQAMAYARQMWELASADEGGGKDDAIYLREVSELALRVWRAMQRHQPDHQPPPELAEWQAIVSPIP